MQIGSTYSIALLIMRAPKATKGAAAHMYMMFLAAVGSSFACRKPMRVAVRPGARRLWRGVWKMPREKRFTHLLLEIENCFTTQQHPGLSAPLVCAVPPSPNPTVAAAPPPSRPPAPYPTLMP